MFTYACMYTCMCIRTCLHACVCHACRLFSAPRSIPQNSDTLVNDCYAFFTKIYRERRDGAINAGTHAPRNLSTSTRPQLFGHTANKQIKGAPLYSAEEDIWLRKGTRSKTIMLPRSGPPSHYRPVDAYPTTYNLVL